MYPQNYVPPGTMNPPPPKLHTPQNYIPPNYVPPGTMCLPELCTPPELRTPLELCTHPNYIPPPRTTYPPTRNYVPYPDNKRAVRILLECILVIYIMVLPTFAVSQYMPQLIATEGNSGNLDFFEELMHKCIL